jgi:hypothetical protein
VTRLGCLPWASGPKRMAPPHLRPSRGDCACGGPLSTKKEHAHSAPNPNPRARRSGQFIITGSCALLVHVLCFYFKTRFPKRAAMDPAMIPVPSAGLGPPRAAAWARASPSEAITPAVASKCSASFLCPFRRLMSVNRALKAARALFLRLPRGY